jgi:predicted nucleic acid-binding protein
VIFVDSSYFIARFLPRDGRHVEAAASDRATSTSRLLTSNLVLGETWTFLRRRSGYEPSMRWLDSMLGRAALTVERIDEKLEAEAWAWLRAHDERAYSFVDATSFALMRKKQISDALAFDGDFAAAGFNELRA